MKIIEGDRYRLVGGWAEDGYPPQRKTISIIRLKILEGDTYRRDCGWAEDGYPPQRDNIFATIENFRGR